MNWFLNLLKIIADLIIAYWLIGLIALFLILIAIFIISRMGGANTNKSGNTENPDPREILR